MVRDAVSDAGRPTAWTADPTTLQSTADPTTPRPTANLTAERERAGQRVAPVVVGVDGSTPSMVAVRLAAQEAARYDRPLRIVHAFNWTPDPAQPSGELREPAERIAQRAAECCVKAAPTVPVDTALLEGPPLTILLRESGAAAMLVIGDGGLGRGGQVPVDAIALDVAARAGCRVLVVRDSLPASGPVVVGVDGSPSSHLALDEAFDAAHRRGSALRVVRAWDPVEDPTGTEAKVTRQLSDAVEPCQRRYPDVRVEQRVCVGDPKEVIVAESAGAELVVASARGEQPWRGMLGAVSQALLRHCTAPVLITRGGHEIYIQG